MSIATAPAVMIATGISLSTVPEYTTIDSFRATISPWNARTRWVIRVVYTFDCEAYSECSLVSSKYLN